MRKLYSLFIAVIFFSAFSANAQVTVTNPANTTPGLSASYPTLAAAITDLNLQTAISGQVILTLGAVETAPAGGYSITAAPAGISAANNIVIDGGSNTVTAFGGQTAGNVNDAIFKIIGADYITIQNFTMQENGANTITAVGTNNMTEWGVALLYATTTNGAQNNIIQNNTISLSKTYLNSFGIYSSVQHSAIAPTTAAPATSAAGANSGNKIYSNTLSNVNSPIYLIGGTTTAAMDNGNDVGGSSAATANTITNWGGGFPSALYPSAVGACVGIYINQQINENVSYNTITNASFTATTNSLLGILKAYLAGAPTGTLTSTITFNTITLTDAPTTGGITGISSQNITALSTATISINNNFITAAITGGTATSAGMTGINNSSVPGTLNIRTNIIRGFTSTATTGGFVGIANSGAVVTAINIKDNTLGDATQGLLTFAAATTGICNPIQNSGGAATCALTIDNNTIRGMSFVTSGSVTAILNTAGFVGNNVTISNNSLGKGAVNFISYSAASAAALNGINNAGGALAGTVTITANNIQGISYAATSTAAHQYIFSSTVVSNTTVSSNTFTNLSVATSGNIYIIYTPYAMTSTGIRTYSGNSIVTGFTRTVASANGLYCMYDGAGSSVAGSQMNVTGNSFGNITNNGTGTFYGYYTLDYSSSGSSAPVKTVANNNFNNINTGNVGTAYIMYVSGPMGASSIHDNAINNLTSGATSGIYLAYGSGLNMDIYNNSFTGATVTGGATIYGMYFGGSGLGNIYNNTLTSCTQSGAGAFYSLYNTAGSTSNIYNNTVTGNSNTTAGTIYGAYVSGGTTINVYQNKLNTLSSLGSVHGVYVAGGTTVNIRQQQVSGGNDYSIYGLTSTGNTTVTNGITTAGGTAVNLFKNNIYNISNNSASTTATASLVNGISMTAGTTVNAYNNTIGNLTAPAVSYGDAIRGVSVTSTSGTTSYNIYDNTVYLNASSTGTNFGTTGIYHTANATATTAKLDLRNNIVVNLSTPAGTGITSVLRRSAAATYGNYATTSNRNLYYAGTPSATRAILNDNGTVYGTSAAAYAFGPVGTAGSFQNQVTSSREANSFSDEGFAYGTPGSFFQNFTGPSANFLHLVAGITTQAESGASVISTPAITDDYDGQTRNASNPDVGADEFVGITPAPAITNITVTPGGSCTAVSHVINADVTTPSGSITSVVLNYNNGSAGSVPMTFVSGSTYTATIPAGTPGTTVTFSISSTNSAGFSTAATGTPYTDVPQNGITATAGGSPTVVCSGSPVTLSVVLNSSSTTSPSYTAPTAVSNPTTDEDLGNITITSGAVTILNNTSARNSLVGTIGTATGTAGSYSNFTSFGPYSLVAGQTYNFSASTLQNVTAYSNAIGIYIDYNRNGSFADAGEAVYVSGATTTGAHTETGSFTVPASVGIGYTRMRIVVNEGLVTGPTMTVGYGEFEEYMINLSGTSIATSYSWSDGATTVGTSNPQTVNPANATASPIVVNYTASVGVAGCLVVSNAVPITVNPLPAAPTDASVPAQCGAPTFTATTSTLSPIFNFYDAATGGTLLATNTTGTYTLSPFVVGSNSVWVTVTGSGGCTSNRAQLTVISSLAPAITLSQTGTVNTCVNTIQTLTASSLLNYYTIYSWAPIANLYQDAAATIPYTGQNLSTVYYRRASATAGETITVTGSEFPALCSNTASVTFVVTGIPSTPVAMASAPNICSGASVTLTATIPSSTCVLPVYTYPGATGDDIGNVTFAGINNTTGDAVTDYTSYASPSATVAAGSTYPISLMAGGTTSLYTQQFGVWIDYNQNGVFEASEFAFATSTATFAPTTATGSITIPAGAYSGTTKMRVISQYSAALTSGQACGSTLTFGEIEDYNVTITGGPTAPAPPNNTGVTFVWRDETNAIVGSGSPLTINPAASHTYTATATNAGGCPSVSNSVTVNLIAPLSGVYSVGAGNIGGEAGHFNTLTEAVNTYNTICSITGPVTFALTDATYSTSETFPITINANVATSSTNTLTIKPNTGVTPNITGSYAGPLLKVLNNYTTIDGSNSGGTSRDMTITNTSATTPGVFWLASTGTTPIIYTTVKNTNMVNGANTNSALLLTDGTSTSTGAYFNNITLQNNSVQLAYVGMFVLANTAGGNGANLLITGNTMTGSGANALASTGIYVQGVDGNAVISNNTISNISSAFAANVAGIWLATATNNSNVSGNTISNLTYSGASSYTAQGIYVTTITGNSMVVNNNTISNITSNGSTNQSSGIYSSGSGSSITNNTITGISQTYASGATNFGIFVNNLSGTNVISGNTLSNITNSGTATVSGICLQGTTAGVNIFNNNITNVKNINGSGYGAYGMQFSSSSTTAATKVYNNFISDVAGVGNAALARNGYGIAINGGAGYDFDYNSISLGTNQTAGTPAAFLVTAAVTTAGAINLVDNILSISATGGTPYAIYSGAPNTVYGTINYNDYYSAGVNLAYLGGSITNVSGLGGLQTAFGQNANSVNASPIFISATDLHLVGTNTALNAAATPIAGITADIDGDVRDITTPDIGADEFTPASNDAGISGIVSYQFCAGTQSIQAVLNNYGLSNLTSVNIDWKVNGASQATNPWTGNLAPGASTIVTLTLPYNFVSGTNYTIFVTTSSPNGMTDGNTANDSYTTPVFQTSLSGTYTIGAGQNFTTLTAAVAIANVSGLCGPTVFSLVDPTYGSESFPIIINSLAGASATNTLTIKPATTSAITGSSSTGLIVLNGADYITIDGSNGATANTVCPASAASRNLTLTNTSTSTTNAVVWLQTAVSSDAATNNNVINCNLVGSGNTQTLFAVGAGSSTISTTSLGTGNINNKYINNNISKTQYGIYSMGASAANKNTGTVINQNLINTAAPNNVQYNGIWVGFDNGVQVSGNNISNLSTGNTLTAISLGMTPTSLSTTSTTGNDVINGTVTSNTIGSVTSTSTTGFSAAGIYINQVTSGTTLIANNMISGVNALSTSPDIGVGIYALGGTGSATQIYHNSVSMTGTKGAATFPSYALALAGNFNYTINNNILINTQTSTGTGKAYAIGIGASAYTNFTSDYNDLFVTGSAGYVGQTGGLGTTGTDRTTLANWTSTTSKDANSKNVAANFVSATDLHLVPGGNCALESTGTPVAVTTDIDCTTRSATPDLGADEFTGTTATATYSYAGTPFCNTGTGTITFSGTTGGTFSSSPAGVVFIGATGNINLSSTPAGTYLINYTVAANGSCAAYSPAGVSVTINAPGTWTGLANDQLWNTAGNWTCNAVPSSSTAVTIPASMGANSPTLPSGVASALSISIATGSSFTVSGTGIFHLYGTATVAGTGNLNVQAGTLDLVGGSIAGASLAGNAVQTLTISGNNSSIATGATPVTLTGNMSFLTGGNTFTTNGNLVVGSSASGTANVTDITNNGAFTGATANTIVGNASVERYIPAGRKWRFLAVNTTAGTGSKNSFQANWMEGQAPSVNAGPANYGMWITDVPGLPAFDATSFSPTIKWWNGSTYIGITDPRTAFGSDMRLHNGAYMTYVRGDRSATGAAGNTIAVQTRLRTYGNLAQNNQPYAVPTSPLYTTIGNPYASAIDLTKLAYTTTGAINIAMWDPNLAGGYDLGAFQYLTSTGAGQPFTISPGGGSYTTVGAGANMGDVVNTIESGQAFFITAGGAGNATIREIAKVSQANPVFFTPTDGTIYGSLSLRDTSAGSTTVVDGVAVHFGPNFNTALTSDDARKLGNTSENVSVKREGVLLAVEYRNVPDVTDTVQLNLASTRLRDYQWKFNLRNMSAPGRNAWLVDRYNNSSTVLNLEGSNTYNFTVTATAGTWAADRFYILFKYIAPPVASVISINATRQPDATVAVKWSATHETGIQYYQLESSADNSAFSPVNISVTPTNNAGGTADYGQLDMKALAGDIWYRIRSVSYTGAIKYSPVAHVDPYVKSGTIAVNPNPVSGRIIHLLSSGIVTGDYTSQITDAAGRVVFKGTVTFATGTNKQNITLQSTIAPGDYLLQMANDKGEKYAVRVTVL